MPVDTPMFCRVPPVTTSGRLFVAGVTAGVVQIVDPKP
jgi:hypothetical protein